MLFSSLIFIFAFLPLVWLVFHALKALKFKAHFTFAKIFLIAASLFFYAWWKVAYLPILLSSIAVNFCLAKMILRNTNTDLNAVKDKTPSLSLSLSLSLSHCVA